MDVTSTEKTSGVIGSCSQRFEVNEAIYAPGQISVNSADDSAAKDIAGQVRQSYRNVGTILEAAGSGSDKIFKTTCFLADMGNLATLNEVYTRYSTSKPVRNCVVVKTLLKGVLCEIKIVAVK